MADAEEATSNHDTVTTLEERSKGFKESLDNFSRALLKLDATTDSLIKTLTALEQNVHDGRNETAILRGANTTAQEHFDKHVQKFNNHVATNARVLSRHDVLIILALGFSGLGAGVNIQALIARLSAGG